MTRLLVSEANCFRNGTDFSPFTAGKNSPITRQASRLIPAMMANTGRQPKCSPASVPTGTPSTRETLKPMRTILIALPFFSGGAK